VAVSWGRTAWNGCGGTGKTHSIPNYVIVY
jgi:hypothetical protein